jgi:transposase-like protein
LNKLREAEIMLSQGTNLSVILKKIGVSDATYYRWLKRLGEGQLKDRKGGSRLPWNRIRPDDEAKILVQARASPKLSCRQIALSITD